MSFLNINASLELYIQAFDINGLDYMMPEVVESGDGAKVVYVFLLMYFISGLFTNFIYQLKCFILLVTILL
jgi:hypothetical protein